MPGTTAEEGLYMHNGFYFTKGEMDFVGGACDGNYLCSTLEINKGINGRKSWFMFDEGMVALGIVMHTIEACNENIITTLNQCFLRGDVIMCNDNGVEGYKNIEIDAKELNWVLHEGIGYYLPSQKGIEKNITEYFIIPN